MRLQRSKGRLGYEPETGRQTRLPYIRKCRIAIATNTRPIETLCADGESVGNGRYAQTATCTTEDNGVGNTSAGREVRRHRYSGRDVFDCPVEIAVRRLPRIDSFVGKSCDSEDFLVAKARVERSLNQHVWCLIKGNIGEVGA